MKRFRFEIEGCEGGIEFDGSELVDVGGDPVNFRDWVELSKGGGDKVTSVEVHTSDDWVFEFKGARVVETEVDNLGAYENTIELLTWALRRGVRVLDDDGEFLACCGKTESIIANTGYDSIDFPSARAGVLVEAVARLRSEVEAK